jgi:hypothetical protein
MILEQDCSEDFRCTIADLYDRPAWIQCLIVTKTRAEALEKFVEIVARESAEYVANNEGFHNPCVDEILGLLAVGDPNLGSEGETL